MNWFNLTYKQIALLGINLLIPFFAFVQNLNIPLSQTFSVELERSINASDKIIHASFKPILQRDSKTDSAVKALQFNRSDRSWVSRALFYDHFFLLDTGKVRLTVDPLFNLELGADSEFDSRTNANLFKNTRGFVARLELGEQVAVESTFRENQAVLPFYLHERTRLNQVAYGQGRTKAFKDNGFDFAMASAYISYSPSKKFNFQIGHGKHFVGNGSRSLLLSDVAFNAPFLRINSNWLDGKLQYQNLYTLYQNLNRLEVTTVSEGLFERKQAATHYLEYSPTAKINIGLFESTIFPSIDTTGNLPVGFNSFVPVIFLNTLMEGDNSIGNNKVGINLSYNLAKTIQLYGQLALQSGEAGFQLGAKLFPHKNIMLQAEFNSFRNSQPNLFHHYNESLAHPLQEDASEVIGIAQFQKKRWLTRVAANAILMTEYDIVFLDARQSFIVNPSYNFTIHIGVNIRGVDEFINSTDGLSLPITGADVLNSNFIYFGLSTNLQNIYVNY